MACLVLANLNHCYVHLPEIFVSKEPGVKVGAIVSIRSIQTDNELYVMWNGQLSPSDRVQLDLSFGQANKFQDELVIISLVKNLELVECSLCRVELVNSSDYSILSLHSDANLLDTCRLVNRNLVIPIFVSKHVRVFVKVLSIQPDNPFGLLTKWTEMQYQHNLNEIPKNVNVEDTMTIEKPIPFLSSSLGIAYKPRLHLGSVIIYGEKGSGKTYFLEKMLYDYRKFNSELFNCKQLRGKRPENIKKRLNEILTTAFEKQPSIIALDDIDSFLSIDLKHEEERGQDIIYKKRLVDIFCNMLKQLERSGTSKQVVIVASCRSIESLDQRISRPKGRQWFNEVIKIGAPDLQDRVTILKNIITEHKQIESSLNDTQLEEVSRKCGTYMPSDLRRLVERAVIRACSRSTLDFSSDPLTLQLQDLLESIEGYTPSNLRGISLQVKTSKTFDNVGGMKKVKEILLKTVLMPIKYPKLFKKCPLKSQNSILLYGPPGCGKTLIAEALTNQEGLNSICVRGPELLSKYIGASEAAVRDLFKRAEMARPCVIFFDEFESLVAKRGTDSTGVTDRVVNQFLTLMDGVERISDDVFIIAATSRPDMIDPAMLRPGRLDRHIYCPVPDADDRREILKVLTKNMDLKEDVDLINWSLKLERFTGADIQSLLYSAQLKALHEQIGGDTPIRLSLEDEPAANKSGAKNTNFEIKVGKQHLNESFDDLRTNVDERFMSLIQQYPSTLGQVNKARVSVRATLA